MANTYETASETRTFTVGGNYSITIQDPTITQRLTGKTNISVIGHVSRRPTRYSSVKFLSANYSVSEGWVKINFSLSISSGAGGPQIVQYEDGSDLSMGASNISYIVTAYATFTYDEPTTSSGSTSSNYSGSVTNLNGDYHNQMGGGLYIMDSEGNAVYVGHPNSDRNKRTFIKDISSGTITSSQANDATFVSNYLNMTPEELDVLSRQGVQDYNNAFHSTNYTSPVEHYADEGGTGSSSSKVTLPSGYNYHGTQITELTASPDSRTKSLVSFDLTDNGYKNVGANFIKFRPISSLYAWANEKVTLNYKYQGNLIEFVSSNSCPCPTVNSSVYAIPFNVNQTFTDYRKTYRFMYDSSSGYIKFTDNDSTSGGQNLVKAHGCFFALQGGGGGGGDGKAFTYGVSSTVQGAGGGGGGGFVLVYVNLKNLYDRGNNGHVKVKIGAGGSHGGGAGNHVNVDGTSGSDGGDTTLYIVVGGSETTVAVAGGGKGGVSGNDNSGGAGGGVSYTNYNNNITNEVCSYEGKSGGKGGLPSGYVFGIPLGTQGGLYGVSFSSTDTISIPMLKDSGYIQGRSAGSYTTGTGTSAQNGGTDGYTSGGGGGGASVMGYTNGLNRGGYGVGGYGSSAESACVHEAQNGLYGACIILATTNL